MVNEIQLASMGRWLKFYSEAPLGFLMTMSYPTLLIPWSIAAMWLVFQCSIATATD